jgi:microsomal dipeptidase-like Zn-dependent dipeptidase
MKRRLSLPLCVLMLVGVPAAGLAQLNSTHVELQGIIDIHSHVGPATALSINRTLDAIEAAQIAQRHGMRAIVFKQHYLETASWAYLVSRMVPGIQLFGGIALNRSVGGLNPNAVEQVATFAGGFGRVVYMPTFESEHYNPGSPIAVPVSKNGQLLPAVHEVFKVMAKYDMGLSTGHSSPQESLMLIKAAKAAGVNRIYVQHPMLKRVGMSIETQKEAAKLGALLEYVLGEALGSTEEFNHWVEGIKAVGPENVVLSSDLGQWGRSLPTDGFKVIIPRLRKAGFTQDQIDTMTKRNPARFLGLENW